MTAFTVEALKKMAEEHFNEVVINYGFGIVRFVGYAQSDEEVYYVVKNPNGKSQYSYLSCVGEPTFLKGKLTEQEYKNLDEMLEVNGCSKEAVLIEKKFEVKTNEDLWKE